MIPLIMLAVCAAVWLAASIKYVGADEVGLRQFFGEIEHHVFQSGLLFVPWCPGIELVRIPTKQLIYRFDGSLEHRVWSKEHQGLLVDISGYVRFPYNDIDSLILMIQSGVPLTAEGLQDWMEDEIITVLKDVMVGFDVEQAIGQASLYLIRDAAKRFFLHPSGLFVKSGICGKDPSDFTPGTGELIVRIEQVNPTPELQEAMQSPVLARFKANAAKETARMNAEQIGGQILGIVARMHGMTIESLEADLRMHPENRNGVYAKSFAEAVDQTKRDRASANGEFMEFRAGNADGSPMSGELPAFAAAALLLNRGGGRGKSGGQGKGGKGSGGGDREKEENFIRRQRENNEALERQIQQMKDQKK